MEQLVLEYDKKHNIFWPESFSNLKIVNLGHFLTDDVNFHGINSWKEFINNPKELSTAANYSYLDKTEGKINIYFWHDYFKDNPNAEVFEVTTEQLNYILDRWQEACENKPNKIIITRDDNGKITVDFED